MSVHRHGDDVMVYTLFGFILTPKRLDRSTSRIARALNRPAKRLHILRSFYVQDSR